MNFHIDAALHVGISPVEIMEALIQLVPFTGFVRPPTRSPWHDRSLEAPLAALREWAETHMVAIDRANAAGVDQQDG